MADINYLDFDLMIQKHGEHYRVQVLESPSGEASATFKLPFEKLEREHFILEVKNYLLRASRNNQREVRRLAAPEMSSVKSFGTSLFEAVFQNDVKNCLHNSIDMAGQDAKLRIRLRLTDVPELADIPWEFLYNSSRNNFLALSEETALVRQLDQPTPIRPLTVPPPLQVLVMISSPEDYQELDVQGEWDKLNSALKDLIQHGLVSLERLDKPTLPVLRRHLSHNRNKYHIFHFIGHGGFDKQAGDGALALEDDRKKARLVDGQELGTILYDYRSLRLVILNACEGAHASRKDPFAGIAQRLIQKQIPAVVAMQFEISDEAAKIFAYDFYGAIADGLPLEAALAEARKAIYAEGNAVEWGTPVLYLRAPDGLIFKIDRQPQAQVIVDPPAQAMVEPPQPPLQHPMPPQPEKVEPDKVDPAPTPKIQLQDDRGIMDPNSPFYVKRSKDAPAIEAIERPGEVVVIKGSGQMGKSTLLGSMIESAKKQDKLVAYIDFQRFGKASLSNGDMFFRQFCTALSLRLDMESQVAEYDKITLGNTDRCTQYVSQKLLKKLDKPVVLAMDEVDSFFDADFRSDFFAMLRSWFNEGAFVPIWKQLNIVVVTSARPYLLIDDQGSPFNIGIEIELSDFSLNEVEDLNRRYGSPLSETDEHQGVPELMRLLGGHPFLVRRALFLIASGQCTKDELFTRAHHNPGPFGEHLGSLSYRLSDRDELSQGMKDVLTISTCKFERIVLRLEGLGLVVREQRKIKPRCLLYEKYFKEYLNV